MRTDFSTVLSRYGLFTTLAVPTVRKQAAHGCERRGGLPERARSLAVGYHMFRRPTTQHVSICNYISYGQPSDLYSVVVLIMAFVKDVPKPEKNNAQQNHFREWVTAAADL